MIDFPNCPICQISSWESVYEGDIRNGHADNQNIRGIIKRCSNCNVERLNENSTIKQKDYTTKKYRSVLKQNFELENHIKGFSSNILNFMEFPISFEEKIVADLGCSAGVTLDLVQPSAKKTIAIEPTRAFSQSLIERNHEWFSSSTEALIKYRNSVDILISNLVIEHVQDPVFFLKEASLLLKKDGFLVLSTPNRNDVLAKMVPEAFNKFNYRTQHRWYFEESSLRACFKSAGFNQIDFHFIHTLGISNMLSWLENKKVVQNVNYPIIDDEINSAWVKWVKSMKLSDKILVVAKL